MIEDIKSKIEQNKIEKKEKLLTAAYELFGTIGINKTSIQDIATKAGVAKGTFYLYFKNKDDIRNHLIYTKTQTLFTRALQSLQNQSITSFDKQIIYVINFVIDELTKVDSLTTIIDKDLSLGFYSQELTRLFIDNELGLYNLFIQGVRRENIPLKNPDITFFMIVELIGATCFRSLVEKRPKSIEEFKPHLFDGILALLHHT